MTWKFVGVLTLNTSIRWILSHYSTLLCDEIRKYFPNRLDSLAKHLTLLAARRDFLEHKIYYLGFWSRPWILWRNSVRKTIGHLKTETATPATTPMTIAIMIMTTTSAKVPTSSSSSSSPSPTTTSTKKTKAALTTAMLLAMAVVDCGDRGSDYLLGVKYIGGKWAWDMYWHNPGVLLYYS